ncbi:major facilitator superfamily domain-containing protein [Paraphoma chrysanthemicola]|uniref:Major facilitator superfamily domain-containing protein n=1 Tax=Paraphoma chrysanthemicola TaxID=798071 RepID=A0A8K0RCM4_9PLEO|nr:major facilitator superfamily domain-containing protein [Paraphoma chrysanthemicola]
MSTSFPFVVVPSSISAHELYAERPMLFLAIMTVASSRNHEQQMRLDAIYRRELAQRTIIAPRRTLGLVQSVLVYLSWIAAGMQKPNLLKHTPHMSQWAQDLKDEREYESDETMHYLVALRQLDDQVQDSLFTGDAANMPLSDARTLMHMRFLESQLADVALRPASAQAQPRTNDPTQLDALLSTLEAGKRFFDALLSFPIHEYHFISFSEWMRLPTVLMTVAKLCIPSEAHTAVGWDVKAAQDRMQLNVRLESLCYRMQKLSTYDKARQTHPDFWYAMRFINDMAKAWYMRRIRPTVSSQMPTDILVGQTASERSGPSSGIVPTPSSSQNLPTFGMDVGSMNMSMSTDDHGDPFAFMKDLDFDMEQFFDIGIWGDETYKSMGFGHGLPSSDEVPHVTATTQYPRGVRLVLITAGLMLSIFLSALDSTIISTAIPSITTELGSVSNIAWYGSAYIITNAAFQPCWGKAYHYFPLIKTFLLSILVFEIGNIISAAAPSSELLILGRIVAGMGGGGVMTGAFISIALTAGPDHRAAYMGLVGITFGTASVVGPLLGGLLTDGPGWRWCFWISLPIGFTAALTVFLTLKDSLKPLETPWRQKLINLDLNGGILIAGCFCCFVLAMHWIGIHPWTSARVVGSFVGFAVLLLCFIANEWVMGDKAMVQARLFKNRLLLANLCYIFFLAGAFFPLLYTLPIQFQSVNSTSASQSGVRLIPLVLGVSVFTMISNGLLTFWRHYKPWLLMGALLATAGNAVIYTLDANTATKQWIGYELITATGVGLALQVPMIANQALVPADDMPAATSLTLFVENCGTALFVASGEAAFTTSLLSSLRANLPQMDARHVLDAGATQIRQSFKGGDLDETGHLIPVACAAIAAAISLSNAVPAAIKEVRIRMKKIHEI